MIELPPTPAATSELARKAMRGNRRSDTRPEARLRKALHARGLRFRKDLRLIGVNGVSSRADIVFTKSRLAVFVDGCFWHGCPAHCRMPTSNREYWKAKISRNMLRDRRVSESLEAADWRVIRVWEHAPLEEALEQVEKALSGGKRTFGG
ncbi:very short patch repair endonuclease [soil metagenome]